MKKKLTILLTALSACAIVGCSNGNNAATTKNTTEAVVESTSEVVTETEAEAETTEAVIHEERVDEERETEPRMSNSEINSMTDCSTQMNLVGSLKPNKYLNSYIVAVP